VLTYALAVLAACANAVSSVLQRKANKRVPQRENLSLRQIWILLHQPLWFGGILAITAGFLLPEWLPTAAMTAGLAGLLYLLAPSPGGTPRVHWYGWLSGVGGNLVLVGCLVLWARRRSLGKVRREKSGQWGGSSRAAVLAVAAGSTFGLTAALMKAMTRTLSGCCRIPLGKAGRPTGRAAKARCRTNPAVSC